MLGESTARVLSGGVESLELEDPPVAQDRQQDLVVVDAKVVDAGLRDLRGLADEARDPAPGISNASTSSTIARTAADGWILSAAPRMSR